ncbi:hypothetical protein T12_6839 [Trichinella patagoniensis]|nr:hypothetical protein T12_6839 [Trichinella patagoniensis]
MGRARRVTTPIHHTTCYPTLTSLFLPPVDLQKGERDTQPRIWSLGRSEDIRVQSNDRCRRIQKTSSEDILRQKECLCSRRRSTTNNCCTSLDKEDEEEEQSYRMLTGT